MTTGPVVMSTMTALSSQSVPVLPNELLIQILRLVDNPSTLATLLFVCKLTYKLVSPHVYTKVIFPDDDAVTMTDIIRFCHQYGRSLKTIKLPQRRYYPDTFFSVLAKSCPNLMFLQSSVTLPQLVHRLMPHLRQSTTCFMLTQAAAGMIMEEAAVEDDQLETLFDFYPLACCSCCFAVASNDLTSDVVTRISHYYHHPGALRNAILPTFGADLLSLTLNPYDILTASVAHMIISRCPRLRFLVVPAVKAEGLWMILRWCDTLVAVVVGSQDEDELEQQYITMDDENEKAVASVEHYKRVWCIHPHKAHIFGQIRKSWHIGIIPRK